MTLASWAGRIDPLFIYYLKEKTFEFRHERIAEEEKQKDDNSEQVREVEERGKSLDSEGMSKNAETGKNEEKSKSEANRLLMRLADLKTRMYKNLNVEKEDERKNNAERITASICGVVIFKSGKYLCLYDPFSSTVAEDEASSTFVGSASAMEMENMPVLGKG
jgi:hypothetical protein